MQAGARMDQITGFRPISEFALTQADTRSQVDRAAVYVSCLAILALYFLI
jgi:hypothetical protein